MSSQTNTQDLPLIRLITEYCQKTDFYLYDNNIMDQNFFLEKPYFKDTCAFYCLQINKLAAGLSQDFINTHSEINWQKIAELKNVIAPDHISINTDLLWEMVQGEGFISTLLVACQKLVD